MTERAQQIHKDVIFRELRRLTQLYYQVTGRKYQLHFIVNERSSHARFDYQGNLKGIELGVADKELIHVVVDYAHELAEVEIRAPYLYLRHKPKTFFYNTKRLFVALKIDFRALQILHSWDYKIVHYAKILRDDECFGFVNRIRCFLFKKVLF